MTDIVIHVMRKDIFYGQFKDADPKLAGLIETKCGVLVLGIEHYAPYLYSQERLERMQKVAQLEQELRQYIRRQKYAAARRLADMDTQLDYDVKVAEYRVQIDELHEQLLEPEAPYIGRTMYDWFLANSEEVVVGYESDNWMDE